VVVRDFDVVDIVFLPAETNAELIVNADTVLSTTRAFERLETIAGRNREFPPLTHAIELGPRLAKDESRHAKCSECAPGHCGAAIRLWRRHPWRVVARRQQSWHAATDTGAAHSDTDARLSRRT